VVARAGLVVDTRNALRGVPASGAEVVKL